jgi:hypothetical protein
MAKVNYIVYTEPVNHKKGNEVCFFLREWDTETNTGISKFFLTNLDFIIPSFEMPNEEALKFLEQCQKSFPQLKFNDKYYSTTKKAIWAYVHDKALISGNDEEKILLPKSFLTKKTSYSQQQRFYYPPYTIVNVENNNIILPDKMRKSSIDLETIIQDKKCALDIETIDYLENSERRKVDARIEELKYMRRECRKIKQNENVREITEEIKRFEDKIHEERISNVILNFGPNQRKAILTIFKTPFEKYNGYEIIRCGDNDDITKQTDRIIHEEDPLILYGFNIEFDQRKLRELGEEYLPGVNETKPVYKSVQGLKNIITKGRFTVDLYGYLFMYRNLYENNKLETHAQMAGINFSKGLSYEVLAHKTKKAEQGSVEDMKEVLKYVVEDGETTYELGERNVRKIFQNGRFSKRDSSTICTTSGKNIMKEFWQRQFFLKRNTLRNRYEKNIKYDKKKKKFVYAKNDFSVENYKDEILELKRDSGLFENVSLVYPLLFVKSFWPMIEGTKDNLRFNNPDECYNSYQLLNEYISQAVEDFKEYEREIKEDPTKIGLLNYRLKNEFNIELIGVKNKIEEKTKKFNEILDKAGLINYSKKFLYVKNPDEIVEEGLGFVYGKGNCLMSKEKIISLLENNHLIYQGFGLSKGKKTQFGIDLMREFLKKRLSLESEDDILRYIKEEVEKLESHNIPKEKLLIKDIGSRLFEGKSYGFIGNEEIEINEFLDSTERYNPRKYLENFLESYKDLIYIDFKNKCGLRSALSLKNNYPVFG